MITSLIVTLGILLTGITGAPVGVGLALTGIAILHFVVGDATSLSVPAVWNVFINFTLSAVPLFMLMGEVLLVSGISKRLYNAIAPFFRRLPGRLLHTNIAACTIFGSVSSSSMSTAAAIGAVAYPELSRRGYQRSTVVATLAAGGTLGLLIPPSNSLLIYGATQDVSIGKLFLAGILPGLMMAAIFMLYILVQNIRKPELTTPDEKALAMRQILVGLLDIWPIGLLVIAVLGSIYGGFATPTEAAGLGAFGAIVIGFISGNLDLKMLAQAFVRAAYTFGTISFVMMGALILAQAVTSGGLPFQMTEALAELDLSKYAVLGLVVILYLILGCFFDGISLILMTLPLVYPVMTKLGFHPVWLGVVVVMLIEIGMLTPPVGINLFVLAAITKGEVSLEAAARASSPYWLLLLLGVLLLTLFPQIALFLPSLMS